MRSARAPRARANDLLQTALKLSTPERPARQGRTRNLDENVQPPVARPTA